MPSSKCWSFTCHCALQSYQIRDASLCAEPANGVIQGRQHVRRLALACQARIFFQAHISSIMQPILNLPMPSDTRQQLRCSQTTGRCTRDAIAHFSTTPMRPLAQPHHLKRLRQVRPALILRQHTAAGQHTLIEPPMPQIDRAHADEILRQRARPRQVVGLWSKQQSQIIIQGRLVLFHNPAVIAASFDNLRAQVALGKHRVTTYQHTLETAASSAARACAQSASACTWLSPHNFASTAMVNKTAKG